MGVGGTRDKEQIHEQIHYEEDGRAEPLVLGMDDHDNQTSASRGEEEEEGIQIRQKNDKKKRREKTFRE